MRTFRFILFSFLIYRILLFLPVVTSYMYLPFRKGYEYIAVMKFGATFPINHFLLYPWANFDGVHYISIAGQGYTNNYGFFPLYPFFIWLTTLGLGKLFGSAHFFAGFFISNISFLLSLFVFYKLLRLDYDEKVSKKSVLFLLVFPTSFFFVSLYTESLFFLLSVMCFYFLRQKKWFLAGTVALFLSVTRVVGVAIIPALLYELYISKKLSKKFYVALFPLFSLGLYSFLNFFKTNDFLYFVHAQGNFANNRSVNSVILFPQTTVRYIKILSSLPFSQYEFWISFLELSSFFFAAIFLYIALKKRVRISYILFSIICFLLPISTGTFTALPRYILVLFPMFIAISLVRNKLLQWSYITLSVILLFVLLFFFSKGYFVA